MELHMEKRCISAYVENQIGVLAKISGLFAGKNYNLDTLTVGETEDPTMSRMTIELTCDDLTYEQIIKQLNRSVEVIKVIDFTDIKEKIHGRLDHRHINDVLGDINPTAENIAKWIADELGPKCFKVEVQESEGNTAIYERD